ncbi:MAG: hypothetical protein A2W98_10600 [Bacteroidetes bacterium GWF2_33_38]|nr:MAG: hypothetical protein A2W98_10600 [Bacteroidetes bacterium GWF2_33_38]OFY75487.1 MAG: hypothetical protein A2265_03365 [Bacteroidetes bacterium RIFOXYA12_FULL_33_9]
MVYKDETFKESIQSVLLYNKQWELSRPLMVIDNNDTLKLSFDDINNNVKNYYYKIIHCNSEWESSNLFYSDYMSGFEENEVNDYKFSINTLIAYVHYNLFIPNEQVQILKSGNYIIQVYEDNNPENIVFTRRFYCVENKVHVNAICKQATDINERNTSHEIDFKIETGSLNINNPYNDIKVTISQNGRPDGLITNLKPQFVNTNELIYEYDEGNLFSANNEFRNFDMKSIRYQSENIGGIQFIEPLYHVGIKEDLAKTHAQYFFENDINGKYLVKITEGDDSEVEADYVMVHFRLPYEIPFVTGNIYLYGALTDWQMNAKNRMQYNFESHAYEISLLLKQGYYNYAYAYLENGTDFADLSLIEGSHYETENEYHILVYYKDISDRYERLIGFQIVNSNIR